MNGSVATESGVTLSWLQLMLGVVSLLGTVLWSWHSIASRLEVTTAVQSEQLGRLFRTAEEQQRLLADVRERVARIEERGRK
ncbi:MAG: hypothetical protein AMXMBFR61_18830 [Fimbriimonadales bacterium]